MYKTLLPIFALLVFYSNQSHGLDIFKIRSVVGNFVLEPEEDTDGSYFLALKNDSSSKSQRWILDFENALHGSGSIFKNLAHITLDFQVLDDNLIKYVPTLGTWVQSTWENFSPGPRQNWKLKWISGKNYKIVNDLTKRCININEKRTTTEICHDHNVLQLWKLENLIEDDDQIGWSKKWINLPIHQHFKNDIVSIYFDPELDQNITWINNFVGKTWRYCLDTYGNFGPSSRLFSVFHQGKKSWGTLYSYGYVGLFYMDLYGNRNAIDIYYNYWTEPTQENMDLILDKISQVVKNTIRGHQGNSQIDFLTNSWRNICIYDIYRGLNMSIEAENFKNSVWNMNSEGKNWFIDWYYKIYKLNENVMPKLAKILEKNYPKSFYRSGESSFGEFVQFWSGVAGQNLQSEARNVLALTNRTETEFQTAKLKYPEIAFLNDL